MANSWQLVPHRAAIPGELLAGMVVALGIIPEAIAFSIVTGVEPQVGLFGSICILIVVSLLGGRPGMVSACTAGVALLMGGLMQSHGLSYLLAASILAGVFQIIWGYLRLAQQMRFVPRAVTVGFVNAIGVLIFLAQLPQRGLGRDGDEVIPSLAASGASVSWPWVWALVALGLLIIYQLPRLTRVVPSTLVAILVISGLAEWGQLPVPRVGDLGQLPTSLPLFQITRNLAIAVLVGVALAGILFSRKVAKVIAVTATRRSEEWLHYSVRGQLFFVSTVYFLAGFKQHEHPARVTIDLAEAHIWDQTGMRALDQVVRKLRQGGSEVELLNLNAGSLDLFQRISESSDALVGS